MVGLAVLVVMYTLGNSVLNAWRLPTRFPDMFIFARPGLTREQGKMLEKVQGIRPGEVLPIAVTVSRLNEGFFAIVGAAMLPDATMFLGVDPDKALSMMELDFRAGNAKDAAEKLKQGRHLIVTNEFKELKGLTVGSKIKANIQTGFRKLLLLMSTVAFAAIGVAALGVTNTIMASIRTRRWQLGVLRSIGITRWQMLRLILAEALLLGLVGCGLGVLAGLELSLDGRGIWKKMIGDTPPLDVPWDMVWLGVSIILGVAFLARLWPAASAAPEEPLLPLQTGRAATS